MNRAFDIEQGDIDLASEFAEVACEGMHLQGRHHEERFDQVMMGKVAEIAFKKFCASEGITVYVDVGIYPGLDGIDESDIFDYQERPLSIDIKGLQPNAKHLLIKCVEAGNAEIYVAVLVSTKHKRAKIEGWLPRKYAVKNAMLAGEKIPGTNSTLRVDNYVVRLEDIYNRDSDIIDLINQIKNGKLLKEQANGE